MAEAYPSFEQSRALGFEFAHLNEQRKVQITESDEFPAAVKQLSEQLSSPAFLTDLEYITGISKLLAIPAWEAACTSPVRADGSTCTWTSTSWQISKPFELDELLSAIRRELDNER